MEWLGIFEVPEADHRVGGRLVIDEGESLLRLYGSLMPGRRGNLNDEVPLVWGTADNGKQLTLVDLTSLGGSWLGSGPRRSESWICGHAIEGLLTPQWPLTFSAVTCEMTYLSSWLQAPRLLFEDKASGFIIDAEALDLGRIEMDNVVYEFHNSVDVSPGFDASTISYPAWVTAVPTEERELEDLVNSYLAPIEALVWAATGRFSDMSTKVRVETEHGAVDVRVWSSWLKPRRYQAPTRRLAKSEMLFTADDLPGGFENGVARWLNRWKEIRHAVEPVIARQRAPFSYTNDLLATAVAALEAYATVEKEWAEFSDDEMQRRKIVISDALSEASPDLVEWTVEAIEMRNRETLRHRLKRLVAETGSFGKDLLRNGKNRRQFIDEGVESRNKVAHLLPAGGLSEGGSLYWAHRGFLWLLRFHLMMDLGFTAEETRERITSTSEFRQEAERIQRDLESRQ